MGWVSRGQARFFDCLRTVKQGSVYPNLYPPMAAGWLTNIPLWFNDCNCVVGAWQNWRNLRGSLERKLRTKKPYGKNKGRNFRCWNYPSNKQSNNIVTTTTTASQSYINNQKRTQLIYQKVLLVCTKSNLQCWTNKLVFLAPIIAPKLQSVSSLRNREEKNRGTQQRRRVYKWTLTKLDTTYW